MTQNDTKGVEHFVAPYFLWKLYSKKKVYMIVGHCIEVWKILGYGFSEVVYKDAMEIEFLENQIPYLREPPLRVSYKDHILKRTFNADFTVFNKIIVEVKSGEPAIIEATVPQALNYLRASDFRVGLIINFGKTKRDFKRLIL